MKLKASLLIATLLLAANSLFAGSIVTQRVVNVQGFTKGSTTISLSGLLTEFAMDRIANGVGMTIYNSLDSYLVLPTSLQKTKTGYGKKYNTKNISVSTKNGKFQWTEKDVTDHFMFAVGYEKVYPEKATFKSSGTLDPSGLEKLDTKKLTVYDKFCAEQGLGYLASFAYTLEKKGKNYQYSMKDKAQGIQVKVSVNAKGKANASYKLPPDFASPAFLENEYIFTNKFDYSLEIIGSGNVESGFVGPDQVELKVTDNKDKFRFFTRNGERITNDFLLVDLEDNTEFTAVFGNYDLSVDVVGSGSVNVEFIEIDTARITPIEGEEAFESFSWGDQVSYKSPLIIELVADTTVTATFVKMNYLVVDISGGCMAESWPYRISETGPDVEDEVCRTTELWLRYIPAGVFIMGSPKDEYGRGNREVAHNVTLTKGFYIGVFEMTRKQYELIAGKDPSGRDDRDEGGTWPVIEVTFETLRGSDKGMRWPADDEVDSGSFMGIIRAKTGLRFDLPTEAQWEYACRATTTTAYNNGKNLDEDHKLSQIAYYEPNSSMHTHRVGSLKPNLWGLYDMHGNVWEWCLDWYYDYLGTEDVVDPVGLDEGTQKTLRGGSFCDEASACRSAYRAHTETNHNMNRLGFRPVVNQ